MKQKAYLTTSESFQVMREIMESGELKLSHVMWIKKLYAYAAKHLAVTESQADVIDNIAQGCNLNFYETLIDSKVYVKGQENDYGSN